MCFPMSTPWLLLIFGGFACLVHASEEKWKIGDADTKAADLAKQEMDVYCKGAEVAVDGFNGLDLDHRKGDLQNALGGENPVTEVFKKAKNEEDRTNVFYNEYGTGWFIRRGFAFFAGVIVLCCALAFCCLSRCTCCNEEQPTTRFYKIAAIVIIAVVLLGVLICTIVSITGFTQAQTGAQNAQCTAIQFLSTAMNGQNDRAPNFVGIIPLLKELEEADKALDLQGNHGFSADMSKIMEKTDQIKKFVDMARETMKLLTATMALNLRPKDASDKDMFHDCGLCKVLQDHADKALVTLDNSVPAALAKTREDVEKLSTDEWKEQMHKDFADIRKKTGEYKEDIRGFIENMLSEGGSFRKIKEQEQLIEGLLLAVVIVGSVFAAILTFCAGISVYRFTYHEMYPEKEAIENPNEDDNPYNEKIEWYAASTWCYGFCYMVILLMTAGGIFGLSALGSGLCLLASDLDSNLLQQMGPALGFNASSTPEEKVNFEVVKDIVDQCFKAARNPQQTEISYLFDIIYTEENGKKVTLTEKLRRNEENTMSVFKSISDNLQTDYVPLATDPDIVKLLNAAKAYTVKEMLVGDVDDISASDDRGLADAKIRPEIKNVLGCSMACNDKVIGQDMGDYSDKTMIGMEAFSQQLATLSTAVSPVQQGCIKKVTCIVSPKDPTENAKKSACISANKYLDIKIAMFSMNTFRCDLFENPDSPSSECDPLKMTCGKITTTAVPTFGRRLQQSCTGDVCVDADGKATTKEKTCTLEQFNEYVSNYHGRLEKLITLIDEAVSAYHPDIKQTLDFLLLTHGGSRAQAIANSVTCNFIAGYYEDFIDGACYQGIYGTRKIAKGYVWTSILTGFLVVTMYAVYCRSKSNHKNWKPDRTEYKKRKERLENPGGKKNLEEGELLLGGREVVAPTQMGPPKTKWSQEAGQDAADE